MFIQETIYDERTINGKTYFILFSQKCPAFTDPLSFPDVKAKSLGLDLKVSQLISFNSR